jgi:hypothetical protein
MIRNWTSWKRFPSIQSGESVEAPVGPGIYEVRHISNGDLAAFDTSANVAYALSSLLRRPPSRGWKKLFGVEHTSWQGNDLEYRTCAAETVGQAKMMAECLLGRRQAFWRRTAAVSRAGMPA